MESIRKIVQPRTAGPVDLSLILNSTVNIKVKLQLVQKISDAIEECCRSQNYFDNMIFVLLKLLSMTEPAFSPDNDIFKLRKLILQIIHKVCSSNDKIKNHIQNTMGACLKVMETDNEQCVVYCVLIFKELLTAFKPKFDGSLNTEIVKFLKLVIDMYNNSNTQDQILTFQKTGDLKVLISTIRLTTTITKNSVNYIFIPMGKVSMKVLKEVAHILKLFYMLFYSSQSFKNEIIEFLPILMSFFNLDIPYKPDYRDLILDLKHAQVRLLFFFAIFLKDNKDEIRFYCSSLPGRVISLLNCNLSSDVSSLRTELLSGFESVILIDYKSEFLPFMDKFLDETLITGKSWSLKSVLRPKAYIYIDHLITHLHNQLSLNFLVRVIHLHFSNILDTTLQPEVQINLCNMVMNVLSYIVQRQNQLITNINTIESKKNSIIDLFYRVFKIFVIKLKQFQKFYLPQLDEKSFSQENVIETISSILEENRLRKNQEFIYGYHSSQIVPYTIADCKRFIKIIIPAIRTLFQFIVKFEGCKFSVEHYYKKSFKHFITHSFLSLKVCNCPIQKTEMVKEILGALSCINPIHLKTLVTGDFIIKLIYDNNLESLVFDMALNDEVLVSSFSCLMLEFVLNNLINKNERQCIFDLVDRLQLNLKLHTNEETINEYIYKIIKRLLNNLQNTQNPLFYLGVLKIILMIMESAEYEFGENMNSVLRCLFCDLFSYYQRLPDNSGLTKLALAELCIAECVFNVVLHSQIMNVMSVITYALQKPEMTPQGLCILEKYWDILPDIFFNDSIHQVRNEIMKRLYHCLDSPLESISQPAMCLLGKFGGLNRSSIVEPYQLIAQEYNYVSEKPNIRLSFEEYSDQSLEINIEPGISTAVETLISNNDKFNRAHSWNVIKGFLMVSMESNINETTELLLKIDWEKFVDLFSNNKLQYAKTFIDETYIKALTGLIICCEDNHLNEDAIDYLNKFTTQNVHISISNICNIPCKYSLQINPCVLIDAIIIILSNENVTISNMGVITTRLVMNELHIVLGEYMAHFPFIKYMYREFCKLCYDRSWICKRGGCSGLQVLFLTLLKEEKIAKQFSNWFIQNFFVAFRAMLFVFSDFNGHLTFGTLEIARSNLNDMLYWLYWTKPTKPSVNLIHDTILKEIIDYITSPNDLLRDQAIGMVNIMAKQEQITVSDILNPYNEHIQSTIPGKCLFNTYTYKSQIGIMKGHIFYALHCIPAYKLDFSIKKHKYYFNILCIVCRDKDEEIKKKKIFKFLTSQQLSEFRQTAMQVLIKLLDFLTQQKKIKVFRILFNALRNPEITIGETVYQCLKSCDLSLVLEMKMVDKLLFYYSNLFQDHQKITLLNTRYVLYLSKLIPSHPDKRFCVILINAFKYLWNNLRTCENKTSMDEHELILENVLETICIIAVDVQFNHIQEICEIILNENILNIEICNRFYPLLTECLLKFPEECLTLFFKEQNIKNLIWTSFFNSIIRNEKFESLRKFITLNHSRLETLLSSARIDPSKTIQYESIKIIFNLVQMDKKWIATSKNIIGLLLNIWSNSQYKERYKNLAAIKSTEWDEPKMLLKIILAYFKNNVNEVCVLFQILPVFSYRFPVDINFFRKFLDNEVINSFTIQWKRLVFFQFIELYSKKGINSDILGKVLQYLILPCFSMCYKIGKKDELLCVHSKPDENIIGVVLNKIFNNMRTTLTGCDLDGIKVSLCQLICLVIDDLLNFHDNICDLIYNTIISCTWIKCTMDINVKFHCYLILTYIMLSGNSSKRDKLNQGIYYELLKASFAEAQPVINYSLNLIVSAVCDKNKEVNTLVVCIKKIMMNESQSVPILHHICSFLIKYNSLFYPYKQFLIRNILGSLFPIAKNNNVPEFKKTAIELACMIIKWELTDEIENVKSVGPVKRKNNGAPTAMEINSLTHKKKSSETIDNCLNFLAMVGCQTHDDKQESRISKLAMRSALLFKNILSTEAIDCMEVKLKFGWIEKLLDTFLKKENLIKQNPNAHGNTNASVMNLLTTFDIISFMFRVLCQKLMLEAIKPLQDHFIKFLQLASNETLTISYSHNKRDILMNNRLTVSQIKQYNEGTLKLISELLETFPTNEGLENLHVCIKMIISEGLNSNCPCKLEVSLTLLKASLTHFPNFMDNEKINIIGDIIFKYNENNKNPSIKVKCLEILKIHVDTLSRSGKQVFIEKVVMEILDKAKDIKNNIPFEVQMKCFELVLTYIRDFSEATQKILLNSIFLEFIKTTTDKRITTIILNVIDKWIEICRDESVFFNPQIIGVLKYTSILNRFPNLSDYCYKLNYEIFKNWLIQDCIEYGLDCKSPSIRFDFFNVYNTLWHNSSLCMRLFTVMSGTLNCNLEFSLAFYIEFLFIKICKDTKLKGDFKLFNTNKLYDINEPLAVSENKNSLAQCVTTFNMCLSLAQLCYVDAKLAKNIWVSMLPSVWDLFNNDQKILLSARAIKFLTTSELKNNFMSAFYEAINLCQPKIYFDPYHMVYIGRAHHLWHEIIEELEDACNYFDHTKKNEVIEGMIQMYSLLREEDVLESIFQNTIKCEGTKTALSLEQQGRFKLASQTYIELLNNELFLSKANHNRSYNKDKEFKMIRLTKCLRELKDWNLLFSNVLIYNNSLLYIENLWKKSIDNLTYYGLLQCLENKQEDWPTKLNWKYHFYLGMLNLQKLDEDAMFNVQEHMKLAIREITAKWKELPKYKCNAHFPLLQAIQLIVEVQEANDHQKSWLKTSTKNNNIDSLIEIWNNRKPWIGDDLNVWNDFILWRQTYYSFFALHNSNTYYVKFIQDQLKLLFGEIALKQNVVEVCMKTLRSINLNNITVSNWLYKIHLEAKCVQKDAVYKNMFSDSMNLLMKKEFTNDIKHLLLIINGSLQYVCGSTDIAFKYFTVAFNNKMNAKRNNFGWKCVIDNNFKTFTQNIRERTDNLETPLEKYMMILNNTEVLENAWIQWATIIQNYFEKSAVKDINIALAAMKCYIIVSKLTNNDKSDIVIARILWLLTFDDDNYSLLRSLEKCNITFTDLWLPQMLNLFIEKNDSAIKIIISKIGQLYPQEMYLILNRMYLKETMNKARKMKSSSRQIKKNKINTEEKTKRKIKIKKMMSSLQKCSLHSFQLPHFVDQILVLKESWYEELYRNLTECLYLCYDFAFKNKYLVVSVPKQISDFIKNVIKLFIAQVKTREKLQRKRTFSVVDNLSEYCQFFKHIIPMDFNVSSVPTIDLMIIKLRKWIVFIENKINYPTKFVHEFQCSTIYKLDWSVITLPSDRFINDPSTAVGIHNFSGYVHVYDKTGTIVKQLTIRGTDGMLYNYNISRVQGIESEERIVQLFRVANNFILDFKETSKRFLKLSIPRTFTIAPNLRMVETSRSMYSLFEIYKEINEVLGHTDIDFWFSALNTCIITNRTNPLMESLHLTATNFGSDKVLKNWVSLRYPLISDYWTFRKTFIEYYTVICFFEYAFNLIKLKPEMLNINESNGAAVVSNYKFLLDEDRGNLVENLTIPFRMTPSLTNFITPYRKCQIINSLTAIGQCLNNSIDDISVVLKLLLKDEFKINYNITKSMKLSNKNQKLIKKVQQNLNYILNNFNKLKTSTQNVSSDLLNQAVNKNVLCYESPTCRLWL